jgi:TetR/AcrR family transcriptional repressor of mexJK operon
VAAAATLFMEQGYRATTMEAVAAAAGLSKPAVYYHFQDKGSLFVAAARLVLARATAATEAILAQARPLRDRLQAIAATVFSLPQPFTVFDAMMHEARSELRAGQIDAIRQAEDALARLVEAVLLRAAERGEIRSEDPVLVAHGFLALLRVGQARDDKGQRRFPDPERTAARVVGILWDGIDPDRGQSSSS